MADLCDPAPHRTAEQADQNLVEHERREELCIDWLRRQLRSFRSADSRSAVSFGAMRRLVFVLFIFALPLHAATPPASVAALITQPDAGAQLAAALRDATPLVRATAARVIGV